MIVTMARTTSGAASRSVCCICILTQSSVWDAWRNERRGTHLLGPIKSAVSTSSATMARKSSKTSVGVPRLDRNSMVDTIQSGHVDGDPGAIFSANDVI